MRIPSRLDAAVMSMRWFGFLFVAWFVCAGPAHAQDEPASVVPDTGMEQPMVAADPAAPPVDESPAAMDPAEPDAEAPAAAPEAAPPVAGESTAIGETSPATGGSTSPASGTAPAAVPAGGALPDVGRDDRLRSMFILVSAVVLIATLIAIIIILLKRGRESRQEERRYVAEAFLRDVSGSTSQGMYKLGIKPIMLGRVGGKDTEFLDYIVIPSATIGRRHALIEFKDFGYWVMDQGSINGTFVNDRPVSTEVRLKHGDRLRLHKLEFEFVMPELGESGVTVLAHDSGRSAAAATAAVPAASDFVLEPEPDIPAAAGELDALKESVESEEATLLPGTSAGPAPAGGSGDETLLPAGSSEAGGEETLLPASGAADRGKAKSTRNGDKNEDDVFDITGGS